MFLERYKRHADWLTILVMLSALSGLLFFWKIPPITDLLPHLNQVNAFWWALKQPDGLYEINWLAPNTLYYYLLLLLSLVMPLIIAGKTLWIGIFAIQLMAIQQLCRKLKTPYPLFLLSCLISFNLNFYWGFGNFLIAWSVLLLYVQVENMGMKLRWLLTILIIWAHVFFILPLTLWELMGWKEQIRTQRRWLIWIPLGVVSVWFAYWMVTDFGQKSSGAMTYNFSIASRLSFIWLSKSVQGSLQSWTEGAVVLVLLCVLLLPRMMDQPKFTTSFQRKIYLLGLALFLVGFFSPDKGMNTVRASQRWIPLAFQAMVISTPWPKNVRMHRLLQAAVTAVALCFPIATVWAWVRFQAEDASGLQEATANLPANARILTLDFVGFGSNFNTRSVMHAGDLAQLERGVIPNTTFADNPAAFVRFTKKRTYTYLLEWYPNLLKPSDLEQSDVALIGGPRKVQVEAVQTGHFHPIRPIADGKYWHAYLIKKQDSPN